MCGESTLGNTKADGSSQARSSTDMMRVLQSEISGVSDWDAVRNNRRTTDRCTGRLSCSSKNDRTERVDLATSGLVEIERVSGCSDMKLPALSDNKALPLLN